MDMKATELRAMFEAAYPQRSTLRVIVPEEAVDAAYEETVRQIRKDRDGFPDTVSIDYGAHTAGPDDEDADAQFGCLEGIVESRWIMVACWALILGVSAAGALLIAVLLRHIP